MASLQLRKGTAAQWAAANPVLKVGEPGAEWDTYKLKIGDGTTAWNSLAYVGGSGSGITQLTGDVTAGPGSGSQAATIANNAITSGKINDGAVTNTKLGSASVTESKIDDGAVTTSKMPNAAVTLAKMADLAADRLIGRGNGSGTGVPQAISLGTGLSMSATTLNVTASGTGGGVPGIDPRSSIYVPFTSTGIDDEFDDNSFSGWTAVNDGVTVPTIAEAYDRVSLLHPGGGASARLCSYMKTQTPGTNSSIEVGFQMGGRGQSFNIAGLIFADGNTYGAGTQVVFYYSPQETLFVRAPFTNYNAIGTATGLSAPARAYPRIILLRFRYEGSNNWSGWTSVDGQQWLNVTGTFARTLSPTHVGFFVTTWGGASPHNFVFDYFRYIA